GPINKPTSPMVCTPPTSPKNVGKKGRRTGPPTSLGRIVLSTINSSIAPQANSRTPARGAPDPTKYSDTMVTEKGAPPGISAITPVMEPSNAGEGTLA